VLVGLIEDDPSYRRAVQRLLGSRCVGAWPHAAAALAALPGLRPSVLLVDIDLPDLPGHAAVPALLAAAPAAQALMLTAHDDPDLIFRALQAGAVGYLLKTASTDEILAAIEAAAAGGAPFSPAIARKVVRFFAACAVPAPPSAPPRDLDLAALTDREQALLELVADGATDKQVADRLGLSHGSVRNRLHAIYRKLHVTSRTAAALRWRRA
jgi:DNA-binding NarL/FixJ family response regulator